MRESIEIIQQSGQKAAAIVQDLLTLARRGVVSMAVVNLNDTIKAYLASPEHQQLMSHHPAIEIDMDLAEDLMPILGSSFHITKTIMNLVANAAEAQPDGGRIWMATRNRYIDRPQKQYDQVAEGEYVRLQIGDKGSGIAEADLERIFEPFYTKKTFGRSGTGLGMAVVWGTVQDHDGRIDVHSATGEGTVFDVYFPVTRDLPEPDTAKVSIDSFKGNREKVLVVDDIDDQRKITKQILTHLNYEATAVDSGEEAIEFIKRQPVKLIILDMIMDPGLDGLETYRQIKTINPSQKVVIASGFAENERVREALAIGAGAYIRKPYTLEKLGTAINGVLAQG